eukprot:479055-Amphidinium_carterae.1
MHHRTRIPRAQRSSLQQARFRIDYDDDDDDDDDLVLKVASGREALSMTSKEVLSAAFWLRRSKIELHDKHGLIFAACAVRCSTSLATPHSRS